MAKSTPSQAVPADPDAVAALRAMEEGEPPPSREAADIEEEVSAAEVVLDPDPIRVEGLGPLEAAVFVNVGGVRDFLRHRPQLGQTGLPPRPHRPDSEAPPQT